jgi:hypothetical protein
LKISIIKLPIGKTVNVNLSHKAYLLDIRITEVLGELNATTLWATPLPDMSGHGRDLTVQLLPSTENLFIMPGIALLAGQVVDAYHSIVITEGIFK